MGPGDFRQMDKLQYNYGEDGNQLVYVSDDEPTGAAEEGFKELSSGEGSLDYEYDENGNLVKDENKGITSIEYNHLNLPAKVSKGLSEYIVYTYDAMGRKLSQQVFGSKAKLTDYVGDLVNFGAGNRTEGFTSDQARQLNSISGFAFFALHWCSSPIEYALEESLRSQIATSKTHFFP